MATQNPFQQFISGLFGSLSATSATPTKAGGTPNSFAGPYAAGYSAPAKTTARDPRIGANQSYLDPANATASRGTVPYVPSVNGKGGQSLVPNQTSSLTGRPGSSVPGSVSPGNGVVYKPPVTTPRDTYIESAHAPSGGGSVAAAAPAAGTFASATPTAPVSSASISYSTPGSSAGGTAGPGGSDYRTAYTDMLASLYSNDDLKSSTEALNKLRKQAADSQLRQRHEEDRIRENDVGQGLKSYNGQLAENSRLGAREQADLAIASSPYQAYITQAQGAAKDLYGVGQDQENAAYRASRDTVSDTRNASQDALAKAKFDEDVRQFGLRYALDQQQESRLGREAANPKLTKDDYIGQFVAAFTPGQTMADGTPTVDNHGFINPNAFKAAAAEATTYGITRAQFLALFGSQLYTDADGKPDKSYGLTPAEQKIVLGALPA